MEGWTNFWLVGALPSSRENPAESEGLFLMAGGCLISIVLNKIFIVLLTNSKGESTMKDTMNNGCYEKILVVVNIFKIYPKKFIYVFCFWIHSKDLLLFWVFFLQINNNSCPDKQLWIQSSTCIILTETVSLELVM